jgi:hypothetical protein
VSSISRITTASRRSSKVVAWKREKLFGLFVVEEGDLLVQGLVHGLYGVEVQHRIGRGAHPVEKTPHGGVLPVDGEALALAFEKAVAERHHLAYADFLDLRDVPPGEEASELLEVRLVELRGARRGTRVLFEVGAEFRDQVHHLHAGYSNRKEGTLCR